MPQRWHFDISLIVTRTDVAYFTYNKRYVAGVLHSYELDDEPKPVLGFQFYPPDVIHEAEVVDTIQLVAAKIAIPQWSYPFVPMASQQTT